MCSFWCGGRTWRVQGVRLASARLPCLGQKVVPRAALLLLLRAGAWLVPAAHESLCCLSPWKAAALGEGGEAQVHKCERRHCLGPCSPWHQLPPAQQLWSCALLGHTHLHTHWRFFSPFLLTNLLHFTQETQVRTSFCTPFAKLTLSHCQETFVF